LRIQRVKVRVRKILRMENVPLSAIDCQRPALNRYCYAKAVAELSKL